MLCRKVTGAAFVVAVSRSNADVIADECGPAARARMHVIRCGVDLDRFRPPARATTPDDCPRARRLGRAAGRPRPPATGARPAVHRRRRDAPRGQGPDAPRRGVSSTAGRRRGRAAATWSATGPTGRPAAQIEAAGLGDAVAWRACCPTIGWPSGCVPRTCWSPQRPSSDGRREGLPVVLMEAMASGLAVVASDLSGIPELVEDGVTGLLTPPGDPAAIAAALAAWPASRISGIAWPRRVGRASRPNTTRRRAPASSWTCSGPAPRRSGGGPHDHRAVLGVRAGLWPTATSCSRSSSSSEAPCGHGPIAPGPDADRQRPRGRVQRGAGDRRASSRRCSRPTTPPTASRSSWHPTDRPTAPSGIAGAYADRGVRVLALPRVGKAAALEAAVGASSGRDPHLHRRQQPVRAGRPPHDRRSVRRSGGRRRGRQPGLRRRGGRRSQRPVANAPTGISIGR